MNRCRGFTLVELLIVIAIAGILAALAVPIYNGYITRSRQAVANNNLQTLRLAEEAFFFDNNTYKTGTYDAVAGTDTLNIGWKPNEDGNKYFRYTVVAGDCGSIARCFKITVAGADGKVSVTE